MFVDTPGFQTRHVAALNRSLNRAVTGTLADVDVVLLVVEAGRFGADDAAVLALADPAKPVLLVANKLDTVTRRADLAPWLQQMQQRHPFAEFVPMTATRAADAERLLTIVEPYLPEQPWLYEEDALTDRSDRFLAAEVVREKLFRLTGDELPYTSTVVIDKYEEEGDVAPHRGDDHRRARRPQGNDHRHRRRAAQADRLGGAAGARAPARRARLPRALGQGEERLGRRRSASSLVRL